MQLTNRNAFTFIGVVVQTSVEIINAVFWLNEKHVFSLKSGINFHIEKEFDCLSSGLIYIHNAWKDLRNAIDY